MTAGGRVDTLPPVMARLNPRYNNSHHWTIVRNLTRKEVHPRYFQKFRRIMFYIPTGVLHMADGTRIDVTTLIGIANRIGAAEDLMDQAQAVINNTQAAKDAAQAQADALITKAAQDFINAQGNLAAATGNYKAANADLLAFVQALDVPASPPAPPVAAGQ